MLCCLMYLVGIVNLMYEIDHMIENVLKIMVKFSLQEAWIVINGVK